MNLTINQDYFIIFRDFSGVLSKARVIVDISLRLLFITGQVNYIHRKIVEHRATLWSPPICKLLLWRSIPRCRHLYIREHPKLADVDGSQNRLVGEPAKHRQVVIGSNFNLIDRHVDVLSVSFILRMVLLLWLLPLLYPMPGSSWCTYSYFLPGNSSSRTFYMPILSYFDMIAREFVLCISSHKICICFSCK